MFSLYPKHWTVCRVRVNGQTRIAYADKRQIVLWNPVLGQTRVMARAKGPTLALCQVRMAGRTLLASAGVDGSIRLWDPTGGREVHRVNGHPSSRINALCTLPGAGDDLVVSAGGNDGLLVVIDPQTGNPVRAMTDGGSGVQDVCRVTVDGVDLLASVALDGVVRIWDPASGELRHALAGHEGHLNAVSPVELDGRPLVAAAGEGFVVELWDPASGEPVRTLAPEDTTHMLAAMSPGGGTVFALCTVQTSTGVWIASGGDFPGVWLWNPATGRGGGWLGWGGFPDTNPTCSWVRGLASYDHQGRVAIVTCGYDKEVHSFAVQGSPSFRGF